MPPDHFPILQSGKHLHCISRKTSVTVQSLLVRGHISAPHSSSHHGHPPCWSSQTPTFQLYFFSAKMRFDQFCFGILQVEFPRGPGPGQRFWFLPVSPSKGSAPLSLQPPCPPAAAPATAPRGRIPDFLQIKRLYIICFNQDTFERVSTD